KSGHRATGTSGRVETTTTPLGRCARGVEAVRALDGALCGEGWTRQVGVALRRAAAEGVRPTNRRSAPLQSEHRPWGQERSNRVATLRPHVLGNRPDTSLLVRNRSGAVS